MLPQSLLPAIASGFSPLLAEATPPTTLPAEQPLSAFSLALLFLPLFISAYFIFRRQLYRVPPLPQESPPRGALAIALGLAIVTFLSVLSVSLHIAGVTHEQLDTPEGMRTLLMCQPIALFASAGIALVTLSPWLPSFLHWRSSPRGIFPAAIKAYLLALPWVFFVGAVVEVIVQHFSIDVKKLHVIFDLWSAAPAGQTWFKVMALFSAVVVAPVVEEIIFRGICQQLAYRLTHRPAPAIIIASLLFAATHSPWTMQPPVFALSLFLGYLYFRSGSILAPMIMHAIFNAIQFAIFLSVLR